MYKGKIFLATSVLFFLFAAMLLPSKALTTAMNDLTPIAVQLIDGPSYETALIDEEELQESQSLKIVFSEYLNRLNLPENISTSVYVVYQMEHWAYGIVHIQQRNLPEETIYALGHLQPDGTWEIALPTLEGDIYFYWLSLIPASLLSDILKSEILQQKVPDLGIEFRPILDIYQEQDYAILYTDERNMYVVVPDTLENISIGPRFPVPQDYIQQPTRKIYRTPEQLNIINTETKNYEFMSGFYSQSESQLVYVEAVCDGEECSPHYAVYMFDITSGRKDLILSDQILDGILPEVIFWDEISDAVFFDTYDLIQDQPYAGLWRYSLKDGVLTQVDLGASYYNSQFLISPDGQFLLTTGYIDEHYPDFRDAPTSIVRVYDIQNDTVIDVVQHPENRELFVQGWISREHLEDLIVLSQDYVSTTPLSVPEATSGFQRPMVNHHYGWRWLDWTGTVYHPGTDYNGPGAGNADCGTPIYAVANGIVRHFNPGGWGTMVIEHNWQGITVYSQYGHLQNPAFVAPGQTVNRGDHIANMGNTGTITCHLHWEIRKANHPQPTNGAYYTTSVLDQLANVLNYYEDPEWWVDSHGSYGGNQVRLFSQANFGGNVVYSGGLGFSNAPNANSYSLQMPSGWSVKTWRENDRNGEMRCWTSSVNNLQDHGWHNAIRSIEAFSSNVCSPPPPSGQVKLYELANYQGSVVYSGGTGFSNSPNGNSYSLEMPSSWSVKTWRGDNQTGEMRCWSASVPNLQDHGWHNAIQSIEAFSSNVCPPPPPPAQVKLYSLVNYQGSVVYSGGTGFSNSPNANSYSMEMPSGWSVKTWRGDNQTGEMRCWSSSVANLQDHGWHNAIQSIEAFSSNVCPPPPPSLLSPANGAVFNEGQGVTLSWSGSGSQYYAEYWGGPSGVINSSWQSSTSWNIGAPQAGHTYSWRVKTRNSYGESGWSATRSFQVNVAAPPTPTYPIQLYIDANYQGPGFCYATVAGNYHNLDGCSGYNDAISSMLLQSGWSVRLYKHINLQGASKCFTASHSNFANETFDDGSPLNDQVSSFSLYNQSSCPPATPNPPSNLQVTGVTQNSISISWQDNSTNENGFRIYRWGWDGSNWDFLYLASVAANTTSFTNTNLDCGGYQHYRVTAFNSAGESNSTDWVTGQTDACEDVVVIDTWTGDGSWQHKTSFNPGDTIQWIIGIHNTTGADAEIQIIYHAYGPNGLQHLYWEGSVTTGPGVWGWSLSGIVPHGQGGNYKLDGFGLYGDQASQATSNYSVSGPAATPTSPPSPTPTSTPARTPVPTPTPVPVDLTLREQQVWKALLLVYRNTDVSYVEHDGQTKHHVTSMTDAEMQKALWSFREFPPVSHRFSEGEAVILYDIVFIDKPVTSLTYMGEAGYWLSPSDSRIELDTYATRGKYDSVIVHWKQCDFTTNRCVPSAGWGWGLQPTDWANGATYATVANAPNWMWELPTIGEVWLHEWLHGVCDHYTDKGFVMPTHCADGGSWHGYEWSSTAGWGHYYHDLMTGRVNEGSTHYGLTASTWRTGSILKHKPSLIVDYFYSNTLNNYQRNGTVSWQANQQNLKLGTSTAANNTLYLPVDVEEDFLIVGRIFIPSSGVGTYDSVALALKNSNDEYWATLAYGTALSERNNISFVYNDWLWGPLYPLDLSPGWYTVKVEVDYQNHVMRMKTWRDNQNEPDWQLSQPFAINWRPTALGFRHYGQGTQVDDLLVIVKTEQWGIYMPFIVR
jgi:hypothetical protein